MAPTDSRRRPDQRLMEDGEWQQANVEKLQLEQKQRDRIQKYGMDAQSADQEGGMLQTSLKLRIVVLTKSMAHFIFIGVT